VERLMKAELKTYRVYGKAPRHGSFKAMDTHKMVQVSRISKATTYYHRTEAEVKKLRAMVSEWNAEKTGWIYELREVKDK
jgi:hypothetical protein